VKDFVAAVSKAVGKPVNVIVPKEAEGDAGFPAVEVSRVTVPTLFSALSNASQHDVAVPVLGSVTTQYKTVGFTFTTEEPFSADAVWTFLVLNPPELSAAEPANHPPRQVQYFPVAQYLTHFSVEDITAAIETGWKLQGGPAGTAADDSAFTRRPQLLITAGTAAQMELVPQVLQGLSPMLPISARGESADHAQGRADHPAEAGIPGGHGEGGGGIHPAQGRGDRPGAPGL
jgi:hypothetical protein